MFTKKNTKKFALFVCAPNHIHILPQSPFISLWCIIHLGLASLKINFQKIDFEFGIQNLAIY